MRLVRLLPFILLFLNLSCSKSSLYEIYTLFNPKLKAAKNRIEESIGREAEFSFRLLADSSRHSLSAFKGKTIFLNFWATWCPPCVAEIPELNKIFAHYGDKVVVIGISDENTERLKSFLKRHKTDYINGFVSRSDKLNEPFRQMRRGRPLSFLIDPNGIICKAYMYPVTLNEVKEDMEEIR